MLSPVYLSVLISIFLMHLFTVFLRVQPCFIYFRFKRYRLFFCTIFDFLLEFSILKFRLYWGLRSSGNILFNVLIRLFWRQHHPTMIFKYNNKRCEIVHWHLFHRLLNYFRRDFTYKLIFFFLLTRLLFGIPEAFSNLLITQFVVDSIWTDHHEVMLFIVDLEVCYLRFGYQYLRISFVFG